MSFPICIPVHYPTDPLPPVHSDLWKTCHLVSSKLCWIYPDVLKKQSSTSWWRIRLHWWCCCTRNPLSVDVCPTCSWDILSEEPWSSSLQWWSYWSMKGTDCELLQRTQTPPRSQSTGNKTQCIPSWLSISNCSQWQFLLHLDFLVTAGLYARDNLDLALGKENLHTTSPREEQ
jgi:hypothetical protein